jgi:hypothetical protein
MRRASAVAATLVALGGLTSALPAAAVTSHGSSFDVQTGYPDPCGAGTGTLTSVSHDVFIRDGAFHVSRGTFTFVPDDASAAAAGHFVTTDSFVEGPDVGSALETARTHAVAHFTDDTNAPVSFTVVTTYVNFAPVDVELTDVSCGGQAGH